MNLIPIPPENCPHCGIVGGQCSLVISEIGTFRGLSIKVSEEDLRAELEGHKGPKYREGYMVQQIICLNGKGMK